MKGLQRWLGFLHIEQFHFETSSVQKQTSQAIQPYVMKASRVLRKKQNSDENPDDDEDDNDNNDNDNNDNNNNNNHNHNNNNKNKNKHKPSGLAKAAT